MREQDEDEGERRRCRSTAKMKKLDVTYGAGLR